ncbi:MAG: aldo/keto reductase [Bacteroidales bacterium]|nr:aldo/keto reductase [Bacteroidales bacterium]
MERIKLSDKTLLSRISLGFWRLLDWRLSEKQLHRYIKSAIELGVTTFDHADIYGNYECEAAFGRILKQQSDLRQSIELVTKCGIKLKTDKFLDRKIKIYDTSRSHIIESVNSSLKKLSTDYIDLLLIHRPDPYISLYEVSEAFYQLEKAGKVLNFGVSNFNPLQFEALHQAFDKKLVANQIEISPYYLDHFENNNLDFCMKEHIIPMAWSPLAGGKLINPMDEKSHRIHKKLNEIAAEKGIDEISELALAWLLAHPAGIVPVIGTGSIQHLKSAIKTTKIHLSREDWFRIYITATGMELP